MAKLTEAFLREFEDVVDSLPRPLVDRLLRLKRYRGHRGDDRLSHCIKTAYLAWKWAPRFGISRRPALLAGLLHDIGYGIPGCPLCRLDPGGHCGVCHWRTGAKLLAEQGIRRDVVKAVKRHMFPYSPPPRTRLDVLVWLADKVESTLSFLGKDTLDAKTLRRCRDIVKTKATQRPPVQSSSETTRTKPE